MGGIAHRIEKLFGGDEALEAEEVSAIKAAIEAAHHPIEIKPEIDFNYVSATLREALSLIARSAAEEEGGEKLTLLSASESEPFTEPKARRLPPAFVSGVASLLLGLATGYALGLKGKWR